MEYKIGQIIEGTINGIQQYGVFVRLDQKTEGLIHISEVRGGYIKDIGSEFSVGQKIKVLILDIDPFTDQISLSHRATEKVEKTTRKTKVHFWTSRDAKFGFLPLRNALKQQIDDALERYSKN